MTDHHDEEHTGLNRGETAVQDLLIEDAATWRRLVPANDRLNSLVRALNVAGGATYPQDQEIHDREIADIDPSTVTIPVRESARPRTATRGALVAALLIVGLLATIFYGRASENTNTSSALATIVALPTLTAGSIGTPIPGPAAARSYVTDMKTASYGVSNHEPIGVTSHFRVGGSVFLVAYMRGLPSNQKHTLTVQWYLGDMQVLPSGDQATSAVIEGSNGPNQNAAFAINYLAPGVGTAKLYWDLPPGGQPGLYVAMQVSFIVQ